MTAPSSVQEEMTYLNLVADLELEAETPCEHSHFDNVCSQKVLWRVIPPCSCSAMLVCQNARDRWLCISISDNAFRCDDCGIWKMPAEDFIWRAV